MHPGIAFPAAASSARHVASSRARPLGTRRIAFESSTQSRSDGSPARAAVAARSDQTSGSRGPGPSATTAVITSGPRFGP